MSNNIQPISLFCREVQPQSMKDLMKRMRKILTSMMMISKVRLSGLAHEFILIVTKTIINTSISFLNVDMIGEHPHSKINYDDTISFLGCDCR